MSDFSPEFLERYKQYKKSKEEQNFDDGGTVSNNQDLSKITPFGTSGSVGQQFDNAELSVPAKYEVTEVPQKEESKDDQDEEDDNTDEDLEAPDNTEAATEKEREDHIDEIAARRKAALPEEHTEEKSDQDKANEIAHEALTDNDKAAPVETLPDSQKQTPALQQILSKIPQQNQANQNLKQLQDQVNANQFQKGLAKVIHGLAHAPGTPDTSDIDANTKQDEQMYMVKQEAQKEDPGSEYSKSFRQFASQILNKSVPDNVSAAQLEKAMPYAVKDAQLEMMKQHYLDTEAGKNKRADQSNQEKEKIQGIKGQQQSNAIEQKGDIAADLQESKSGTASKKDQDKAETQMREGLEKFRGNKAVNNANEALRNADSAMAIINSKKDLNDISTPQYKLLTEEIGKIATGGVANGQLVKDIQGNTLENKAAQFWQLVGGDPTPAQLGGFIQENRDYLNQLQKVNQNVVDQFRKNEVEAYKNRVTPEAYNKAKKDYSLMNMVKVVSPNGQAGSIPEDKVEDAVKRGFKVVGQ